VADAAEPLKRSKLTAAEVTRNKSKALCQRFTYRSRRRRLRSSEPKRREAEARRLEGHEGVGVRSDKGQRGGDAEDQPIPRLVGEQPMRLGGGGS
jgi:hypothetical protein